MEGSLQAFGALCVMYGLPLRYCLSFGGQYREYRRCIVLKRSNVKDEFHSTVAQTGPLVLSCWMKLPFR
jgi:hypothetical protein